MFRERSAVLNNAMLEKDFDDTARAAWAQRRDEEHRMLSDDPGFAEYLDRADQVRAKAIFDEL